MFKLNYQQILLRLESFEIKIYLGLQTKLVHLILRTFVAL